MTTYKAADMKYWHTVTQTDGREQSYEAPLWNGLPMAELRRREDNKTYIYHVPADDEAAANRALDALFGE